MAIDRPKPKICLCYYPNEESPTEDGHAENCPAHRAILRGVPQQFVDSSADPWRDHLLNEAELAAAQHSTEDRS